MSTIKNEADHLPKEKKEPPLGKWYPLKIPRLNNFPVEKERNKKRTLTTVSNNTGYSQMLNSGQKDERSVATTDDSSPGRLEQPGQ